MHHAHRVFDRNELACARRIFIDLSAAKAWQDVRGLSRQDVPLVELGRDVDGQFEVLKCLSDNRTIWHSAREVSAKTDERLGRPVQHRANCLNDIVPLLPGQAQV